VSTRPAWIPLLFLALLPTLPGSGAAQVPVPAQDGPLPPEVQARTLELLNAPGTLRLPGGARIPHGTRIEGNVAVLGGSVLVGGEVRGTLLVVNGDLTLESGARVMGDVLVVGGYATLEEGAVLEGEGQAFRAPLRYRIRGGRVEGVREEGYSPGFLASDFGFGQSRFTVRAASNYSRIEGLPVLLGPIVTTSGRNPLRLEAFAVWRSVSGLDLESDRLGYLFRLEQALGGRGMLFLGGTAHRQVSFVEDRGVTNLEASLSTFLLRRDVRDYYEREGWSAYLTLRPVRQPVEVTLTYRDEDHASVFIQDPWTLRSGRQPWRPQFRASEGRFRGLELDVLWDSRDDPSLPSAGWRAHLGLRNQVGSVLEPPFPDLAPDEINRLTSGSLDLRRYARVGPGTRLLLRGVAEGALTSDPLPGQFQRSLGGEGTLPGHPRFAVDCGARSMVRPTPGMDEDEFGLMFPYYGCDRTALFQAELQGELPFAWNPVPDTWEQWEWSSLLDLHPRWSLFFNAGRGWVVGEVPEASARVDSPTRADVGVGVFMGPFGLYWTYPLNQRDRGLNFFVRLSQRF
jgi:hypothetical protein